MTKDEVIQKARDKMHHSAETFKVELASIRSGRASPGLVEHLKVDYAGVPTPLRHMAAVASPEARLLVIQPWDKSTIGNIEKAILKSDLGLTPTNDGNVIRINIPPLSEERRLELIKLLHHRIEERRIAVRNCRREAMEELKALEKDKTLSQDEHKRALEQLQKVTDSAIGLVEKIGAEKEAELREI
ncbi:MAG: ribosome recycling factor [Dehalococcoidia bacterium]|nr:MAG: ribosome recycling factor [Dehalococcoidia bacterium]